MKWHDADIGSQEFNHLNTLLEQILSGVSIGMPQQCPACSSINLSLHAYFHARTNKIGGVWLWCSNCGIYFHGSIKPPSWWSNLDIITQEQLYAQPQYLEDNVREIDMHWNRLIGM